MKYYFKNLYYRIRDYCAPRQRWLYKKLPRNFTDLDNIFEITIVEGIIFFVEQDGGLNYFEESQKDPEYPAWQKEFDFELKKKYEQCKIELPRLQKEFDAAWEKVPHVNLDSILKSVRKDDFIFKYSEVNKLEKQIKDLQTEIMIWAVQNRGKLWT